MADEVKVTSPQLRHIAGDLDTAAGHIQNVLSTLDAARSKHWGKWGSDEFGDHFAGDKGYKPSDENLTGVLDSRIKLLQAYSEGLQGGADLLDAMDVLNESTFRE
ncbi:hypothetical protein [Nocardia sp. NPDC057440]|uniref:hypothetical protein n=1 Tax=Nocardia sp. NPDC057440 TaxID=3346134 RepID=UPI00366C9D79